MPQRNGKGPRGEGSATGRGMGKCRRGNAGYSEGFGQGQGRHPNRGGAGFTNTLRSKS